MKCPFRTKCGNKKVRSSCCQMRVNFGWMVEQSVDNLALLNVVEVVEMMQGILPERKRDVEQLSTFVCHRWRRRSSIGSRTFPEERFWERFWSSLYFRSSDLKRSWRWCTPFSNSSFSELVVCFFWEALAFHYSWLLFANSAHDVCSLRRTRAFPSCWVTVSWFHVWQVYIFFFIQKRKYGLRFGS